MEPNKNCLFFAGGKKFNIDSTSNQSIMKLSKNEKGIFVVELKFTINMEEAAKSIFNFPELKVEESKIAEENPNMVYVETYNEKNEAVEIVIPAGNFMIGYDKDGFSEFILKGVVSGSGKTDHPKTDHPVTGPNPTPDPGTGTGV